MSFDWPKIEAELAPLLGDLAGLSLERERIECFAAQIAAGRLRARSNLLGEMPEPADEVVQRLDALSSRERDGLAQAGRRALERGEIAAAVLNGGMATRFGGVVKGIVEVFDGRSFLEIKLRQALAQGPVPFLVMNSFATHEATLRFLDQRGLRARVRPFLQAVSLRLTPKGELFREASGALSPYAPGHGDFIDSLRRSGELARLRDAGVRALLLSNVDNLGAELDPVVVGFHLSHGRPLTVELSEAQKGDVGGTVVRVAGKVQVVEGFRFPPDFDAGNVEFINTNTFLLSLDVLEADYPLTWFFVEKKVDGRPTVQMERLIGELSAFVPSGYLASARGGLRGRFFPVKTPEDLEGLRDDPALRQRFGAT